MIKSVDLGSGPTWEFRSEVQIHGWIIDVSDFDLFLENSSNFVELDLEDYWEFEHNFWCFGKFRV